MSQIKYVVFALAILAGSSQSFAFAPRSAETESEVQMDASEILLQTERIFSCSMNAQYTTGFRTSRIVEAQIIAKGPVEAGRKLLAGANAVVIRPAIPGIPGIVKGVVESHEVILSKVKCETKR